MRKKAKKEKMADYKGGGLTTVHIREASKLVESVRAEVEQLKKSVLEVFFFSKFQMKTKISRGRQPSTQTCRPMRRVRPLRHMSMGSKKISDRKQSAWLRSTNSRSGLEV